MAFQRQPFRINVLLLVGMGCLTILITLGVLAWGDLDAQEVYEIVQAPLMALIGGSLAIAKDLVPTNDPPHQPPTPPAGGSGTSASDGQG